MSKIKFNESSVPSTLTEGAFVVVDGVTYVGNSDNEPVPAKGYYEYKALLLQSGTGAPTESKVYKDSKLNGTWSRTGAGSYVYTFDEESITDENIIILNNNFYNNLNDEVQAIIGLTNDTVIIKTYFEGVATDGVMTFFGDTGANGMILSFILKV